jgi:hypothetical protein
MAEIRAHPWFNQRLPPLYQNALDRLAREQAAIDRQVRGEEEGAGVDWSTYACACLRLCGVSVCVSACVCVCV